MGKEVSRIWNENGEKMKKDEYKEEEKDSIPLPQWMMEMKNNVCFLAIAIAPFC